MAQLQRGDPWHVGPYEVLARLSAAERPCSPGVLYLARYPGAGRVALRVLTPRLASGELRARLSDDVAAARCVASPLTFPLRAAAIVRERAPWIAWQYAPGPSLADVLAEHGRLAEQAVASLAAGLAQALRAIHEAGAVHGDLRPATIFLDGGRPRLTGFGVAAAVHAAVQATAPGGEAPGAGSLPDRQALIAPELAYGGEVSPAADIFSLGAVIALAAGGTGPFAVGGQAASPCHAPYGVPDLGSVPAALRPLVTRCLDASPGWRPTAGEFQALAATLLPAAAEPAQWPATAARDPMAGVRPLTRAAPAPRRHRAG